MLCTHAKADPRSAFAVSAQQIKNFLVIFAAVKKIRIISPFISVFLAVLILAGSTGFTLIHHTCLHCGTDETVAAMTAGISESKGCCHGESDMNHHHSTGDLEFSDDCCTHQTERVVTDELVRNEIQNEIIPYFLAATVVAVIEESPVAAYRSFAGEKPLHCGPDLTTMLCRIRS